MRPRLLSSAFSASVARKSASGVSVRSFSRCNNRQLMRHSKRLRVPRIPPPRLGSASGEQAAEGRQGLRLVHAHWFARPGQLHGYCTGNQVATAYECR
jgi:hypothetical protein